MFDKPWPIRLALMLVIGAMTFGLAAGVKSCAEWERAHPCIRSHMETQYIYVTQYCGQNCTFLQMIQMVVDVCDERVNRG